MASAVKRLHFSVSRSFYWTPPRARPTQWRPQPWQRWLSSTQCRGDNSKDKSQAQAPASQEALKEAQVEIEESAEAQKQSASARTDDDATVSRQNGVSDAAGETSDEPLATSNLKSEIRPPFENLVDRHARTNSPPGTEAPEPTAESISAEGESTEPSPSPEEIASAVTQAVESPEGREEAATMMEQLDPETRTAVEQALGTKGVDSGFWKYAASGPSDEAFIKDNVTSMGQEELERQREYREYARLAAWELPLLSKLAKPFVPPRKSQVLRFRYTSFLGEPHPAATKVVLEFCISDLPGLTPVQRDKLIKLLGVRYNPASNSAKMSCDSFPTQVQNRRYLIGRVKELLKVARDPTDTFEDVPFDFRHHKPKPFHEFPEKWILTEERKKELGARNARTLQEQWKANEEARLPGENKRSGLERQSEKELQRVPLRNTDLFN